MTRVLCAGHVNWDVTLRVDSLPAPDGEAAITGQTHAGGGSASNTAVTMESLGVDSALLGSVGEDDYGRLAREELTAAGVDCSHLQRTIGETTVKYLVVDDRGEVMVLANDGVNESFRAADAPDSLLDSVDHVHLTSQRLETAEMLAERARDAGATVSFAPGRRLDERDYRSVAATADYLFLNEREAETAAEEGLLAAGDGVTVITRGEDGGEVRASSRRTHSGYDVEPVDTTGAGDAFAAGFLAAVLNGEDDDDALAVANAAGALAAKSIGARTHVSWADIEDLRE
ncbi:MULTISPECIES: carbohydrate kinase family protein [Salinibaculum]|uniref:carbohydrate kinase family protein n=1 Tax=Salinibaculum TaxID=2732368 RepID=UPI0030D48592